MKGELKKYPKCKSEIQLHYKATHFCMMLEHITTCREEIRDLEDRTNALIKNMQGAADCMKIFLPDTSAKDNCIMQQSTADEYYEEQKPPIAGSRNPAKPHQAQRRAKINTKIYLSVTNLSKRTAHSSTKKRFFMNSNSSNAYKTNCRQKANAKS